MAKSRLLAQLLIQSLAVNVLDALTQRINSSDATPELLQNHYAIEGSYEDRATAVTCAFRKWLNAREYGVSDTTSWYGWWSCTILGIFDDCIVFCYSQDGGYNYRRVMYTIGAGGEVILSPDVEVVDVSLVIEEIVLGEDADGDETGETGNESASMKQGRKSYAMPSESKYLLDTAKHARAAWSYIHQSAEREGYSDSELSAAEARITRAAKKFGITLSETQAVKEAEMKTGKQLQDAVENKRLDITSAPVSHSDGNPKVDTTTATSANTSGASMPDPNASVTAATPVEHSGDEGVGAAGKPNEVGGPVAAELNDEDAGFKGEDPAHPGKNVSVTQGNESKVGNPEFLLQGAGVDQANNSFCTILSQSTKEVAGKKLLHIQGIATRADIISANNQVYPLDVWEDNLEQMNKQATAGKFIGKLEHPDQEQGLLDTAIRFEKFWIQGADVYFDAVVLDTENGKELQALYAGGVQIDLSSRGYGTAQKQSWRGQEVMVIQKGFVCTAFDAVHHGASTGSAITSAQYQAATQDKGDIVKTPETETLTPQKQAQQTVAKLRAQAEIRQAKADFLATANLTDLGMRAYKQALDSAGDDDLVKIVETSESILPVLQATFAKSADAATQATTWSPTFMVKQNIEDTAPQTVGEMIDRLVSDLPDTRYGSETQGKMPKNHFTSPREACRRVLQNIAHQVTPQFNGAAAAMGLLALEQGKIDRASDILQQSLATGATTASGNADGGGAPLSAPLIFPLVRRVYPRYIMNEIASVQPMDRPEGKIFYLDAYRTEDPAGQEKRLDLNTSSNPFSSSYGDNATEGAAAQIIRLRLSSITVDAHTKKLGAAWSLEEMQDLRAYHGLDAAQELMSGVAREMALEWNLKVLNDMLAQASAAALTFGTGAPATGFPNQTDWDAYIWNYIQKLDNAIFSKRNGPMTHIVAGVDAALALAKSGRMTFGIGGDNGGDMEEQYPGAVYFGVVNAPNGSRYKVMKTNFWGAGTANGSKILGLRRGQEWSDTPYVWAPYADFVTPILTDPSDFSQKQGIISRAANQVVVGDAMGIITVNSSTGVTL